MKRLIEMKKSSYKYEKKASEIQKHSTYSLKYQLNPKKTVIVEPNEGGPIKYDRKLTNHP